MTQPELLTVPEGQNVRIECKTDPGIYSWGLAWYQQKHGEAPKLIIYSADVLNDRSLSRFSGDGRSGGTDFTLSISGVQTEDAGHYYCMNLNNKRCPYNCELTQ